MSREEWLEEHPQNDSSTLFKRKCHTCGRPTDGSYWCSECREKRRKGSDAEGIPSYEFHGRRSGGMEWDW
jgi:hypothetical protein